MDDQIRQFEDQINQAFEEVVKDSKNKNTEYTLEELETEIKNILNNLPKINRRNLRLEMLNMNVNMEENPTTLDLNTGLAKSQGYKDRLVEIYIMALKECKIRKRSMEILRDAIMKTSNEKSADKRQGEFAMRYPILLMQEEAANIFFEEVKQMINNMASIQEAISRQVSVHQLALQTGEVRRSLPNKVNEAEESTKSLQWDENW